MFEYELVWKDGRVEILSGATFREVFLAAGYTDEKDWPNVAGVFRP